MDERELYALPPEEFTAARDRAAKAAGDRDRAKQLKALRRPSVSAWLVNLLAVNEGDLLEQLIALGPALAQAQAQGRGDELRELGAQRRELVEAVTESAVALGERPVTAAVRAEVAATLDAALADPGAAEAVRSGRLVRPLSYAGFGDVDLDGAVALSSARPAKKPTRKPAKATTPGPDAAAAEAAALEAAGQLDDAVRECERRARDREAAEQQQAEAEQAVQQARRALSEAERAAEQARTARQAADDAAAEGTEAVRRAQEVAEQARTELDRLRRGG